MPVIARHKVAFQYSKEWIENGFPISPFSLPLKEEVYIPTKDYFQGLFGVFADSLPDNWGKLLLNRLLRSHKINADEITVLDRLAIVGRSGMGAGIPKEKCVEIMEMIESTVKEMLGRYL